MSQITDAAPAPDSGSLLGGGGDAVPVDASILGGSTPAPASDPAPIAEAAPQQAPIAEPVVGLAPLPENASDDQKRAFNDKLRAYNGVPDTPDKYGDFGFGEELKIDINGEDYKYYTDVFHKEGLNAKQAKGILAAHKEYADKQVEQYQLKNEQAIKDYRSKVKNDFVTAQGGEAKYEVFRGVAEQGFKATAKGAGMTDTEVKGLLNIMGDDPRFVKMFNHIGRNFQEAVLISGASASAPEPTFEDKFKNMFKGD